MEFNAIRDSASFILYDIRQTSAKTGKVVMQRITEYTNDMYRLTGWLFPEIPLYRYADASVDTYRVGWIDAAQIFFEASVGRGRGLLKTHRQERVNGVFLHDNLILIE